MSTIIEPAISEPVKDEYQADALEYRAIHSGALFGLLLGIISIALVFAASMSIGTCLMLLPIPLVGVVVSLISAKTISGSREQYIGYPAAILGAVLSLVFATGGVAWGSYVYFTEVPEGYERISFLTMKPDKADETAGRAIPPEIIEVLDKKVFIKGYIRPDSVDSRVGIDQFLLVRDSNACCFGDLSKVKYYDQLQVQLAPGVKTDFREGNLYRIGGHLVINPENFARGPGYPVYALVGDYVRE